ncbi:MAG TPA: ABC transporter substrate-binding protein [Actinomycetota bacterium]|nr:ABC transporter substrate-binding protein [Actinomycetota bacterium]
MIASAQARLALVLALVGLLGVDAIVAVALAQEGDGGNDEKVTFTWAATGEPTSLNPMTGYSVTDFYFWTPSYHLLVDFDQDFGAEPFGGPDAGLAIDIQVSDDSMEFTYTIRDDVVWSDRTPLTAEDVAYTLNLYKGNHAYLPQSYLTLIDGQVEALDEHTVRWRTKEPTGLYSGEFPYMYDYILPKHVFEELEKPKQFENVPNVASGPFVIQEYRVGEFVRMVRNPEWTGPEPFIDEIVYRIYKNDDAIATALQTGEIDFAYVTTPNVFDSLKGKEHIETMLGSAPSFSEIGLNTGSSFQEPDGAFTPHGDGHPALLDVRVRQAIRMAIDSEELVEKVLLGQGLPGTTIIPPVSVEGARWEPTGDEILAWDIDGANRLLDEAGYEDADGDGVREMPSGSAEPGRPLELRYYVRTGEQTSVDAAGFISEWLSQIGIETNVEAVTSGRLADLLIGGTYDMFSWGWYTDPDPDAALSWHLCDQRPADDKTFGTNDTYYCNPEYDRLYAEQRTQLDPQKRWEIVHRMQQIYYEDAAYAVMWYDSIFSAWRTDRFTGYYPQPSPNGDPLESWGGPSEVWWKLRPVGASTGSSDTSGIPAVVWLAIAGAAIVIAAFFIARGRRSREGAA